MGKVVKFVAGIAGVAISFVAGPLAMVVGIGLLGSAIFSSGKSKTKATPAASSNGRLNKSLNPEDFRKIVFGKTASALDLRYWEVYGPEGTQYDEVIALACHQINAVKELYVESELAIDATNSTQSKYSGVLTRNFKLGSAGQTALNVGSGSKYTAAAKMTGIAHMVLQWTKNDDKLPNGPPSRYTNIVEGALVYDPRRDSTQPGGSGAHRITDQSTWAYATLDSNGVPIGRNNALQALWYLLGWRVTNPVTGEQVLVAGRGIDPNDINIQSFITGANNCEVAGYYTDMILSTENEHTSNEDKITADGLIATLIDPGGLWSYYANVDDTASVAVYITDDDILDTGKVSWNEYKGMPEQFNQVVGKFIDPSATALYQPRAYPMVRDGNYETNLGVKRRQSIDFEQVQDALLAQKLARLMLNQGQYQAEFSANFNYKTLKAQAWSIISYTSERFQWTKLFRVYRYSIHGATGIGMTLREVHPSIWTAGSVVTPVTAPIGSRYDPTQAITLSGLTASVYTGTGVDGTKQDGVTFAWNAPPSNVRRTEVQIKLNSDTYWQSYGPYKSDVLAASVFPLLSNSVYNVRARHISVHEIAGPWVNLTGNFTSGNNSNVGFPSIDAKPNTFRQTEPPSTAKGGDYWTDIDNNSVTYRHAGFGLFINGVELTLNSNSLDLVWVSIQDDNVLSLISTTNNLATNVNNLSNSVVAIQDDNVLAIGEKPNVIRQYNVIVAEYSVVRARAVSLAVGTELTNYTNAYNTLINYFATLGNWQNTQIDTIINGANFNNVFVNYYTTLSFLNVKMSSLSVSTGDLSLPTGSSGIGTLSGVTVQDSIFVKGRSSPIAASKAQINWMRDDPSSPLENEAGIWNGPVVIDHGFNKVFVAGMGGPDAPSTTLFIRAENNGSTADICGAIIVAVASQSTGAVFGLNIIARNTITDGGASKMVGLEVDWEDSDSSAESPSSGAIFVNAFNSVCPIGMQFGAVGFAGTGFENVIGVTAPVIGAVLFANGVSVGQLINTGSATYTDAAIVLSNLHKIKLKGTGSVHAFIWNDSSNNLRIVNGGANTIFRNSADNASNIVIDNAGNLDLQSGGALKISSVVILTGQQSGYGTPSGGARVSNFPGSSATLAQTSGALAQLILDLKAGKMPTT